MATETVQIEANESKTLKFLKQLMDKNPKQNYHGAAVIAMSSLDIDAEMRNPNSKIRKDFLAAIEIQDFIAFINNVLLPEITRKAIEAKEMLEDEGVYVTLKQGLPPSIDDSDGIRLPNLDAEKIKPLRDLLDDVKKLENLTIKLQQFEVDWRLERVNFVKEKLEGALKIVEERIRAMPDEAPEKPELMKAAQELAQDIVDFDLLKNTLLKTKEPTCTPDLIQTAISETNSKIDSILNKSLKYETHELTALKDSLQSGLSSIDNKYMPEYKKILGEISSLKSDLNSSIDRFENSFGKNHGLGDMMQKFDTDHHRTVSALKDALNLDIHDKHIHDLNHFKNNH